MTAVGPIAVVASAVIAIGCNTIMPPLPTTGAKADGNPLTIRRRIVKESEKYKERVATVRDDRGRTVADIYEEGTRTKRIPVWYGYQGSQLVDAEDFFAIAGDQDGVKRVREARDRAYLLNRGGLIGAATGVGLLLVTAALPESMAGARAGTIVGGLMFFGLGSWAAVHGAKRLAPERHPVHSTQAAQAAQRYNDKLLDGRLR